jgi:signal transduction histidine kinase
VTALGKLLRTTVFKLSLVYLVVFAIGAGLVLMRVGMNVKDLFDDQIDQTVEAEIAGLAEQYRQGGIRRLVETVERRVSQPGSSLYLVTTFAGERIAGNVAQLPAGVLERPGLIETRYARTGEIVAPHRALARIFLLQGGFRLLVGRDLEDREALRGFMLRALFTSLGWLVLIGTAGGIFVAMRVLRRVDAMSASAQTIMSGDLSQRLPRTGSGDELDRLATSLNAMLERIGELMKGMQEVSDNIAHDLKTPLTRLRNGVDEALRNARSPDDYRACLEKVVDESEGLIRVFNALLIIARLESGVAQDAMQDFDVAEVARDVAELYDAVAEEQGVTLTLDADASLMMHGGRELIGQALANLVDNAIKHGAPIDGAAQEKIVKISARRIGEHIELIVCDRGPGVAAQDRARVLERFVRLEGSRSRPGSGLGLSLATAVARMHHGALRLDDNAPGLRVTLELPASAGEALR